MQGLCGDVPYTYNHAEYGAQRSREDQLEEQQRAQRANAGAAPPPAATAGQKEVISF